MFKLSQPIDSTILINGETYEVDMSFDNILRFFDMLNDESLNDMSQVILGVQMLLDDVPDIPINELEKVLYTIYKEMIITDKESIAPVDLEGNPMPTMQNDSNRTYDLVQDANYIYASFMQDYQIDLFDVQGELHWYKFQALLEGLKKDTKFKEIVEIRTMELPTGKGTNKQREQIKKAKKQVELK